MIRGSGVFSGKKNKYLYSEKRLMGAVRDAVKAMKSRCTDGSGGSGASLVLLSGQV